MSMSTTANPGALVPAPPAEPSTDPMVALIERLATNKDVDVEKLKSILDMQKGILAYQAEAAFNSAFADMQADIPTIIERGVGDKNMRYARLEDIIDGVRPVLSRHGFSLSHRTEWPDAKTVKVVGILTHRSGHARTSEFLSSADSSGSKNAIQALGSAVAYGRRYTTKDLLNIATRGEDDDGARAGDAPKGATPAGFDDWYDDMQACAEEGTPKLMAAWNKSSKAFQQFLGMRRWEELKKRAAR